MADAAGHLVDRVLPEVPVRQWVLTLQYPLPLGLGARHPLLPPDGNWVDQKPNRRIELRLGG